ncbi:cytochrome c maturation protein CcmE [Terriglobus aquaticus]|uniref:Cytochrome c maturation protein CcmE n=1 Tax=Terriglobus aquaticus TaxID=940139 RepID=A0ABW9KLL7_9BACT|nr:cytochrome c maturation protein CcmE [Terriglobus aquaticus]
MKSGSSIKVIAATAIIVGVVLWLAISGAKDAKSYYVTIAEMQKLGDKAYTRNLRVAGNVKPGSIHRVGTHADFVLLELGKELPVQYNGTEPPPDTFKDDAQALAMGHLGRDGVFQANQLQAKCASKYAPAQPGQKKALVAPTAAMVSR